jgi:Beta/Gamma crystallin
MAFSLRMIGFAALAGAALLVAASPAPAQTYGTGGGLELFEGPNFTGRSIVFNADDHNLMNQRFNDRAGSARLIGGQPWEVCVDAEYRGGCVRLDRDEPDLRRIGMAQAISSVRRVNADWQGGGQWGGGRGGLSLFSQPEFRGQRFDVNGVTPNFGNTGFNDQARSLVAYGPWLVCADADFLSRCERVEGEVWDLSAIGLSGRISSARPLDAGSDWGGGGYPPPHGGPGYGVNEGAEGRTATFFPYPTYQGRPIPACIGGGSGSSCAQRTADDFCRSEGYRGARYFSTQGRGRNAALEDVLCIF